jgi:hypothetical protein
MSEGKLTITIDGDEAKAHAAYMSLTKDQKALVVEIGKMGTAAEKAADQSIQAAKKEAQERQVQIRLADSLVKSNETLTQAYDRQKAALDTALAAGNITAEQHKQTLEALSEKVTENSAEFVQASQEKQEAAKLEQAVLNDHLKVAGKIVNATKSVTDRYNEQKAALDAALAAGKITFHEHVKGLKHIQSEADEAAKDLGKIDDATENGVGQKSIARIAAFAAKFATIAGAVEIVRKALAFYNDEKEKAIGSSDSLVEVRRSLAQVSKGDFDQLEARSEDLTQFGIDRVQARQLVFDARSQGFEGEEDVVAQADVVMGVQQATAFAGEFRKFFGDEKLTIEQALNTAMSAAAESQKNIAGILPQIRTAAQGRLAGGESSDIAATVAVLVDKFGDSTGDRVRGLGIELANNDQTRGMNMIDAMRKVLADPELRKEIEGGSKEVMAAVKGFEDMIDKIAEIDANVEQAQQARGKDSLIRKATEERLDPNTESGRIELARRDAIAKRQKLERENEMALSETAFKAKGAVDSVNTAAIEQGANLPQRMAVSATATGLSYVGASDETIESVAPMARNLLRPLGNVIGDWLTNRYGAADEKANEEARKQTDEIKKQTSAIEKQTSALERMSQFQAV